jgi:hypothetical protein
MTETPIQQDNYHIGPSGSFLKELPPSIKRYTYQGESQFLNILRTESARVEASPDASEFILFRASKETIETLLQDEDASPITDYLSAFDKQEQLFLVKITSSAHGVVPQLMTDMIRQTLEPMGLSTSLKVYSNVKAEGASRGKVADVSWGPKRNPRGRPGTPSVTLEVAYCEKDSALNSDLRFWLDPDNGKAEICLTLRIGRLMPEIRIEKWEIQNDRIHRSQAIWITKRGSQTHVSGYPLVIAFESLFLRPSSCPRERDLAISQEQLKDLAEAIWEEQSW